MQYNDWNIEAMTGYKPISTFYMDMSIADRFGPAAIKDTFRRVVDSWADNTEMFTEFVMVLNWKIWEHYQSNDTIAELYDALWNKAKDIVYERFNEEQLEYYYATVD